MCRIQFALRKSRNSVLVKPEPISETKISGRPRVANICRRVSIVQRDNVDATGTTTSHSSTSTRNCFPRNGPAWSMWSRAQGRVGHSHGCKGAGEGDLLLI